MKKIIALASLALVLVSCNKVATPAPVDVAPAPTGSGYEDKEVQDTMKEIDSILSTDTNTASGTATGAAQ